MTDSRPLMPISHGSAGVLWVPERGDDFPCCQRPRKPREQWTFLARETHWGYTFLVWELKANPRGTNWVGKRFVRWVK
jgi:hypothetical protein